MALMSSVLRPVAEVILFGNILDNSGSGSMSGVIAGGRHVAVNGSAGGPT